MNVLFLMDPLESVVYEKDTTFVLMKEAARRGHGVYFLPEGGITREDSHFRFHVKSVQPRDDPRHPFADQGSALLTETETDAIFIRTDPPFDADYLMQTWLLDQLPKRIPVINRPSGIRTANEKVWPMQFGELLPPSLLSRQKQDLLAFINTHRDVVSKPTDGFGGQSVFRIRADDTNLNVILETMTRSYSRDIILQRYIPESEYGDKRILLLNGEPLGAVLRKHAPGEHRNNFFSGGKPSPAAVTDKDRHIVSVLKPELLRLGLYFVGIDVIGDYLIEVNVTSPTCLQEMNRLGNLKLETQVVDFLEALIISRDHPSPTEQKGVFHE